MPKAGLDKHLKSRLRDWTSRVESLATQVKGWAEKEHWPVHESERDVTEEHLGTYAVPVLRIRVLDAGGEVHLDPVGLHIIGGDGRVDLSAFPSLNRVKLIGAEKEWQVYTDSNVPLGKPWSRKTFVDLARDLAASQ